MRAKPKEESESVEVPAAVAESEQREAPRKAGELPELVVEGREHHLRHPDELVAVIGQAQPHDVNLQYAFISKGGREVLRGRPVAFALWSDAQKNWTIAQLEIPSPPVNGGLAAGHCPSPYARPALRRGT